MGTVADSIKIFFIHVGTQLDALATGTDEKFRHWLNGWRGSADGALLCPFSLLTGNSTGKILNSGIWERQRLQITSQFPSFLAKFPTLDNRELLEADQRRLA